MFCSATLNSQEMPVNKFLVYYLHIMFLTPKKRHLSWADMKSQNQTGDCRQVTGASEELPKNPLRFFKGPGMTGTPVSFREIN